jgi:hypothetical protein
MSGKLIRLGVALLTTAACTDLPVQARAIDDLMPSAQLGQERVDVCHVDESGTITRHSIADPAPDFAFDGIVAAWSSWNSGDFASQWIEVDFGTPRRFSVIEGVVNQLPLSGATLHEVTLDGTSAFTWSGTTVHEQVLSYRFSGMQTAQRIRITTTASPSWVAWFEIRVLGC